MAHLTARERGARRTTVFAHRPSRLQAMIGLSRCVDRGRQWPCDPFINAVNVRAPVVPPVRQRIV